MALVATTALWASNVITYTATEKLPETTNTYSDGLHIYGFNVSISSHEFSNGTGTITFSSEVTTIGDYAFFSCSGLTSVKCFAVNPPSCDSYAFDYINQDTKVYVLASSLSAYQSADVWKDFGTILDGAAALPNTLMDGLQPAMHKVLRNGQLLIETNNAIYSPLGQKVK